MLYQILDVIWYEHHSNYDTFIQQLRIFGSSNPTIATVLSSIVSLPSLTKTIEIDYGHWFPISRLLNIWRPPDIPNNEDEELYSGFVISVSSQITLLLWSFLTHHPVNLLVISGSILSAAYTIHDLQLGITMQFILVNCVHMHNWCHTAWRPSLQID